MGHASFSYTQKGHFDFIPVHAGLRLSQIHSCLSWRSFQGEFVCCWLHKSHCQAVCGSVQAAQPNCTAVLDGACWLYPTKQPLVHQEKIFGGGGREKKIQTNLKVEILVKNKNTCLPCLWKYTILLLMPRHCILLMGGGVLYPCLWCFCVLFSVRGWADWVVWVFR